jgi:hypothetical protein
MDAKGKPEAAVRLDEAEWFATSPAPTWKFHPRKRLALWQGSNRGRTQSRRRAKLKTPLTPANWKQALRINRRLNLL